jgi:hypothetical protein
MDVFHGLCEKSYSENFLYSSALVHGSEFGSERIPRGLLRGKRANDDILFLKNRRFSAACCGELQLYPFLLFYSI